MTRFAGYQSTKPQLIEINEVRIRAIPYRLNTKSNKSTAICPSRAESTGKAEKTTTPMASLVSSVAASIGALNMERSKTSQNVNNISANNAIDETASDMDASAVKILRIDCMMFAPGCPHSLKT